MATVSRIYQSSELSAGQTLQLDEKASHHLAKVLRANINDEVVVFNGKGGEFLCVITKIDKKFVHVLVRQFEAREVESPVQIHLGQGIARGEKMDFIIQKVVELGVAAITPLVTERCNVRLDQERGEKKWQHWQGVIESACEQSGRNRLPNLFMTSTWLEWVKNVQADLKFILSPHVSEKLVDQTKANVKSIAIAIGPEGGLSPQEIEVAYEHGFLPLNLGPRILRTETAALATIAVLQNTFGDF